MRPRSSFIGQPIRSLQTMLRVIAQYEEDQPSVVPDGIYGGQTTCAVSAFHRNHALQVTGVTDQITWETIVAAYGPAKTDIGPAQPLTLILDPGHIIRRGAQEPNVYVLQAVLTVLSQEYGSITPPNLNGILDEATSESLASFQELSGLPRSGELDKMTWKHLAIHYPLAANRKHHEDQNM